MKKWIFCLSLYLMIFILSQTQVFAQSGTTVKVEPLKVQAGTAINVTGVAVANTWVSIKGLDKDGNILYYNVVYAGTDGAYKDAFKAPDMSPGILKIIAGSGTDIASAEVEIYRPSGGSSSPVSSGTQNQGITPITSPDGKTTTTTTTTEARGAGVTASAEVGAGTMTELSEQAKASEAAGKKAVIEIIVKAPNDAKTVEVEIPRDAFDRTAGNTKADVKINTGLGTITFDAKAVDSISDAKAAGDIKISITKVDKTPELQAKVGDRPVYDFTVTAGNAEISKFNGGKAEISIPYTLKPGEKKNAIVVYYIDSNGELKTVRGKYDAKTGTVTFTTTHFSQYAIGYNEVSFGDVKATDWYAEAVGFIAARGIATGTDSTHYSPEAKLTRGQFITMVMRAYNIEPQQNLTENFADSGNTYYTNYLGTAKKLGITTGIGNNQYAPTKEITRQEMMTLLYNTLKVMGELPEGSDRAQLPAFSDAKQIAPWAKEAAVALVKAGTVSGNGGKLSAASLTTRAEMAQVLYNLLGK